jgi:hypothetical protein
MNTFQKSSFPLRGRLRGDEKGGTWRANEKCMGFKLENMRRRNCVEGVGEK